MNFVKSDDDAEERSDRLLMIPEKRTLSDPKITPTDVMWLHFLSSLSSLLLVKKFVCFRVLHVCLLPAMPLAALYTHYTFLDKDQLKHVFLSSSWCVLFCYFRCSISWHFSLHLLVCSSFHSLDEIWKYFHVCFFKDYGVRKSTSRNFSRRKKNMSLVSQWPRNCFSKVLSSFHVKYSTDRSDISKSAVFNGSCKESRDGWNRRCIIVECKS